MRPFGLGVILFPALALCGCNQGSSHGPPPAHGAGRYLGIGVYPVGRMWSSMATATDRSGSQAAATIADDEHVIVVVDSSSGEVRQCGNLSGHCVTMNPWSGRPSPVNLSAHAADLDRGVRNETAVIDLAPAVANDTAPAARGRPDR